MRSFVFPGNIEDDIRNIGAEPIPYMRTGEFSATVLECEDMLLDLIGCANGRVLAFTASGTAAMESCVMNLGNSRGRALVLNGGTFGARWASLCECHNVLHDTFCSPFGGPFDLERFAEVLKQKTYGILLFQHHESSSGELYPLNEICRMCRDAGVLTVVDAISSFLADPISMKDDGVDVVVLSSQKGLNLPPGLSFVVLSERVCRRGEFERQCLYLDWEENLASLLRGQPLFSPATQLFFQLHRRLQKCKQVGVDVVTESVRGKAEVFRAACSEYGWCFSAKSMSNCLTGVLLPFTARPLIEYLASKCTYVMPSANDCLVRVAHLGTLGDSDHLELVKELAEWQSKRE